MSEQLECESKFSFCFGCCVSPHLCRTHNTNCIVERVLGHSQVNKCLKLLGERCPSASNDLLSARAGLKHYLGRACTFEHGRSKNCKKWSLVRPVAESLHTVCLSAWKQSGAVLTEDSRWSCPVVTPSRFPSDVELAKAMLKLHPACYNMVHTKHLEATGITAANLHRQCLVFGYRAERGVGKPEFSAFLQVEKIRTTKRLAPCSIHGSVIHVDQPLTFVSSLDAIGSFYSKVLNGAQVTLLSVGVKVADDGGLVRDGPMIKILELGKPSEALQAKFEYSMRLAAANAKQPDDEGAATTGVERQLASSGAIGSAAPSSSSSSFRLRPQIAADGDDDVDANLVLGANLMLEEAEQEGFNPSDGAEGDGQDIHANLWESAAEFLQSDVFEAGQAADASADFDDSGLWPAGVEEAVQAEEASNQRDANALQAAFREKRFSNADIARMSEQMERVQGSSTGHLIAEEAAAEALLNHHGVMGNVRFADLEAPSEVAAEAAAASDAQSATNSVAAALVRNRALAQQWKAEFLTSLDALLKRFQNIKLDLATRQRGGTSIIAIPSGHSAAPESQPAADIAGQGRVLNRPSAHIAVFQWREPEARRGYEVDLDSEWLLMTVVHVGRKRYPTDYSGAEIVVAQTGVTFSRAKRTGTLAERNELPIHWQRVVQMWRMACDLAAVNEIQAVQPVDADEAAALAECTSVCCLACGLSTPLESANGHVEALEASVGVPAVKTDKVKSCAVCMMQLHGQCADILACVVEYPESSAVPDWDSSFAFPETLGSTLGLILKFAFSNAFRFRGVFACCAATLWRLWAVSCQGRLDRAKWLLGLSVHRVQRERESVNSQPFPLSFHQRRTIATNSFPVFEGSEQDTCVQ